MSPSVVVKNVLVVVVVLGIGDFGVSVMLVKFINLPTDMYKLESSLCFAKFSDLLYVRTPSVMSTNSVFFD